MKSLRCSIGIHKDFAIEGFPLGARNALIVGLQCDRCRRFRCASAMGRPTMTNDLRLAFDEAKTWLEAKTGQRIFGPFVWFR